MSNRILVFYGSYRSDRMGIRLAQFVVDRLRRRDEDVELIDAKAVNLPMLDRMYKEYPKGQAPEALEQLARKIRDADGFIFVTGEYNWGIQPGLKNLTDHFLEEWFWRPAAIVSYSGGRLSGARAATAWHGTLSEMGMVVVSSTIAVAPSDRAYRPKANLLATGAKRSSVRSRALSTISCGGWKRRKPSDSVRRRHIDRAVERRRGAGDAPASAGALCEGDERCSGLSRLSHVTNSQMANLRGGFVDMPHATCPAFESTKVR
jgi:NAD(P)H-dependent FMN reductase